MANPVHDAESFLTLAELAARETVRLIQGAHCAGITTQFAGDPFTAAHTHPIVLDVDAAQYAQGDGPCLTAMRTNQQVAITLAAGRTRWPQLARVAAAAGVRSFLAEPLHAQGRVVGSLNLYFTSPRWLRNSDRNLLTVLTAALDRGLDDYWNTTRPDDDRATQLQERLRQQLVTSQAIGMLMAAHGLTTEDATAMLQQQANKNGVATHQAAQRLISQHPRRPPSRTTTLT